MTEEHEGGLCYFCKKPTDGDHYCFGCGEYICDECELPWSLASAIGHGHRPEDHRIDPDEEESLA